MANKFDVFKQALEGSLTDAGVVLNNSRKELEEFYTRIEQPFNEALITGDKLSLQTFRDRVALLVGRVSFRLLNRNRAIVMATIATVIRVLVALK